VTPQTDAKRRLMAVQDEKKLQLKELEDLNRDMDIFINSFLQEESLEKDKAAQLAIFIRENKELDKELSMLSQQSLELQRQIFDLGTRRDAKVLMRRGF
jgi:hypothetical protein